MTQPMIKVEHLSKQYRIGIDRTYKTLQDAITSAVRSPLSLFNRKNNDNNTIWALKDVSFEIEEGEVVGIIGRNGAGKTTLLKILSRITEPTEGRITLRGRVSSLLEVGTGFHPELTGRENIYLNGSILGMTKREIDDKFDEIVKFAEIEKFLDTPVKRYSSGMYVRLAFAVAAHLEPEILLVDEVLAVGDIQFQKKCLGKMQEVSREGRTVLFVSHNMSAIARLCTRGILLTKGEVAYFGTAISAINQYLGTMENSRNARMEWIASDKHYSLENIVKIRRYCIIDDGGAVADGKLFNSKSYIITVEVDILQPDQNIRIAYAIYSQDQSLLLTSSVNDGGRINLGEIKPGSYVFSTPLPADLFSNGSYEIELLCLVERLGWILPVGNESRIKFTLFRDIDPNPFPVNRLGGVVSPLSPFLEWTATKIDSKAMKIVRKKSSEIYT